MTKLQKKEYNPKDVLMKKQWSKYISKGIALSLMHFNPKSILFKSYKNTSYCAETIVTDKVGKVTTTYCKNRWCQTCNRIRTARLINGYLPQIKELFQPVFVTVTLPTVGGKELKPRIEEMEKAWRYIYKKTVQAKYKKSHPHFKGIRKAECTIRPGGKYHYHFHIILDGWSQGEWFIAQWLKKFPKADRKAQDIRFSDEFSHLELFKYAFKAEVKTSNKTNGKRYDELFIALRGKRTYQAFGGIRMIKEEFEDEDLTNSIVLSERAGSVFKWMKNDWFDKLTGEALIDLDIPEKVQKMIDYPKEIEKE